MAKSERKSVGRKVAEGFDSVIGFFNPMEELRRKQARMANDIMATSTRAYDGAQRNRFNRDWIVSDGSADEELRHNLELLRLRSRDLVRNDGHASGAIKSMVANTTGIGIKPQSSLNQDVLKISAEDAFQLEKQIEDIWKNWVPYCDASERLDFYELQNLIDSQILINGEILILETQIRNPNRPYNLAYQVIEADRLATPREFNSDRSVRNGVKVGERGQPLGYYIMKSHPGDRHGKRLGLVNEFDFVPAYSRSGRKNIYHLFHTDRPGQSRGVPWFAPVIDYFRHKSRYREAEQIAARVAACFTVFIKKQPTYNAINARTSSTDANGKRFEKLSPGRGEYLAEGEDVEFANPQRPNAQYDVFMTGILREICSHLGVSYEQVSKDFTKTNYSSARTSLLEARRYFVMRQEWLKRKFFQPCYQNLLEEAFLRGELGNINFYEKKATWCKARWITPGWKWVDPVKEADASVIAMNHGITTGSDEAAVQGKDFFENIDQLGREAQHIKSVSEKYGVDLFENKNGEKKSSPGRPPKDTDEEEEEDDE